MVANIIIGVLALLIIWLIHDKRKALNVCFIVVTTFLCIRYEWGNDYDAYLELYDTFKDLNFGLFDINSSRAARIHEEFGWVIINRFFALSGLGFFGMIMALTVFESWVIYRTIVKFVSTDYYWVSILFWIFGGSFCVYYSMMRQFLCICLFLLVVDLMIQKERPGYLWWSIGIILLGTTIHRTNIVMLATLPLFYVHVKQGRNTVLWIIVLLILFLAWRFLGRNLIESSLLSFIENSEDFVSYMNYTEWESVKAHTGLGVLFRYMMFVVWLFLFFKVDEKKQSIIILGLVSYFLEVVIDIIPMASRFTMYMTVMDMVRWAWLISYGKKYPFLYVFGVVELVLLVKGFHDFYYSPIWFERCFNYHTIFSAPSWM